MLKHPAFEKWKETAPRSALAQRVLNFLSAETRQSLARGFSSFDDALNGLLKSGADEVEENSTRKRKGFEVKLKRS